MQRVNDIYNVSLRAHCQRQNSFFCTTAAGAMASKCVRCGMEKRSVEISMQSGATLATSGHTGRVQGLSMFLSSTNFMFKVHSRPVNELIVQ